MVTQKREFFFSDVLVRLRGSNSLHEGRVEVFHQGRWGTVCDDHWGFREATVVCRMLNYSAAVSAVTSAHFGEGNSSYPILMDNVKCRGDEESIAACRHNGWNTHNCRHYDSIPPTEGILSQFVCCTENITTNALIPHG